MTTAIKSARIIQPIALSNVPKGEYKGVWDGYVVTAILHGETFQFQTIDGIRGINVKCLVKVTEDSVAVETIK